MMGAPDDTGAEQPSVTITAVGDGTFTLTMGAEADEAPDADNEPTTADNIDDALKMAKQMLGAEDMEPEEPTDDSEQLSPDDAKSAWKQMASKKSAQGSM